MKNLVIPLAIGLLLASQAQASIYNPATGHYYSAVSSGGNGSWINAENNAIALGGHLVTINDAAEEAWLRTNFGSNIRYWIGFNDAAVEATWVWSSGEPVTYTNWDAGKPNNVMPPPIGEDYAVINWVFSTGEWNDWDHQRPDYSYTQGIAEVIPEPSTFITWSLLGALALTVGWWRRRRGA